MDILLSEDLLLLLLDDVTGTARSGIPVDTVLGGAMLVELAQRGAVGVGEKQGFWQSAKVYVVPGAAPSDPLLRGALGIVAERERSAQELVGRLGKGLRAALTDRLAQRGILERRDGKVLGLFPRTTWPARDSSHETDVRRRLGDVLVRGVTPDERTAALVALLHSIGQAHSIVDRERLPARELKARAKRIAQELAAGGWGAKAVSDVVQAATAASTAAVMAAVTASTTASSSGSS